MSVAFAVPCFNEEATIGRVVEDCRRFMPEAEVYVFDNNSRDQTAVRASRAGARVVHSARKGKGEVIRHAFEVLKTDVVIIVDGDDTYAIERAPEMVRIIADESVDMVVCNRHSDDKSKAYRRFHKIGNQVFSWLVGGLLGQRVTDVFSGYRAVSRHFYESVSLDSTGFEIESELTLKAISHGFSVKEISGPYRSRPEGSYSKLRTFHDGFRILKFIFSILRDCRPLAFFGALSSFCFMFSVWAGSAPIADFLREHFVYTVPRAILAASLMVLSIVLLGVGLILDSQIRHFREQSKLIRRWIQRSEKPDAATQPTRLAS
ncbi:MAG: glycosyltransferase family 2 protein [Bdellovibrionota bacterium]